MRYKDNNYILIVSIPPPLLPIVKRVVFALLQAGYDIPLKWEPGPPISAWGVANLTITSTGPHLWRKGVVLSLGTQTLSGPHGLGPIPAMPAVCYRPG